MKFCPSLLLRRLASKASLQASRASLQASRASLQARRASLRARRASLQARRTSRRQARRRSLPTREPRSESFAMQSKTQWGGITAGVFRQAAHRTRIRNRIPFNQPWAVGQTAQQLWFGLFCKFSAKHSSENLLDARKLLLKVARDLEVSWC